MPSRKVRISAAKNVGMASLRADRCKLIDITLNRPGSNSDPAVLWDWKVLRAAYHLACNEERKALELLLEVRGLSGEEYALKERGFGIKYTDGCVPNSPNLGAIQGLRSDHLGPGLYRRLKKVDIEARRKLGQKVDDYTCE